MKKLYLTMLLAMVSMAMAFAQEWTDENGVTWGFRPYFIEDEIVLYSMSGNSSNVIIPSEIPFNEKIHKVSILSEDLFLDRTDIESVEIPSTVSLDRSNSMTSKSVFNGCTNLKRVKLNGHKVIGRYVFANLESLEELIGTENVERIDEQAFCGCSALTDVGNLSSCETIGIDAFWGCKSLVQLNINNAVPPTLGAIYGNGGLAELTTLLVPADAVEAYREAENWSNMAVRIIPNNVQTDYTGENKVVVTALDNGSGLQTAIGEKNMAYVMNLEVEGTINSYDIFAIRNKMPNLHMLDLTNAIIVANSYPYYQSYCTKDNTMQGYEFYELRKLVSVKLPKSIDGPGYYSFGYCSNLNDVMLNDGIWFIGGDAFRGTNLKEIVIPEGVVFVWGDAFASCSSLENVTFPSTLREISEDAFEYCSKLTSLNLPDRLDYIGKRAFSGCSMLSYITIPGSVKSIGDYAFSNCSSLKSVKSKLVDPFTIGQNTFSTWSTTTLYVPKTDEWETTYNSYYWDTQWGQFSKIEGWDPAIDEFFINNDYTLEAGTIGAEGSNPDADMNEQSGFHVKNRGHQKFHHVHVKHNGSTSGSLIGDESNMEAEKLFSDIQISANRWYFFSFPFDVKVADVQFATLDDSPANYVFRYYDGKERAENGRGGWKNMKDDVLKAGTGYIFQSNKYGTLTLPVENPDFTADNKSPQLNTHAADNKQDASWNFVGNPYLSYYMLDDLDFSAPITVWNGSSYTAVRPGDDDYVLQPYQAFFVQKPSAKDMVGFDKDSRTTYRKSSARMSAAKARRARAKVNNVRMLVNLTISDGTNTDNTRVVFNDKQSMDYEMECDASKFLSSEAVPQLYSICKDVKYAINERPNGNGEVALGFVAKTDGTFTIEANRMDTPMLLKDNETGVIADLSQGAYEFSALEGTYDFRFTLMKADAATGIESIAKGESSSDIYDLSGRKQNNMKKGVNIVNGKKVISL